MTEFKNKNENIDNLLSKFYPPEQAKQIKNDFASADALFEKFSAPNPSPQTIAQIKQKIDQQLKNRNRIHWTAIFVKTASVAAIVIIISAVTLLNFNRKNLTQYAEVNQQSASLQNDEKNFGADISLFSKELEQLNSELVAINLGEDNGTNGILTNQVDQVELEIIETENTFWKG
jgi:hypothetical protein